MEQHIHVCASRSQTEATVVLFVLSSVFSCCFTLLKCCTLKRKSFYFCQFVCLYERFVCIGSAFTIHWQSVALLLTSCNWYQVNAIISLAPFIYLLYLFTDLFILFVYLPFIYAVFNGSCNWGRLHLAWFLQNFLCKCIVFIEFHDFSICLWPLVLFQF